MEAKTTKELRNLTTGLSIIHLINTADLSANRGVVKSLILFGLELVKQSLPIIYNSRKKYNGPVQDFQCTAAANLLRLDEANDLYKKLPKDVRKWCHDSIQLWLDQLAKAQEN